MNKKYLMKKRKLFIILYVVLSFIFSFGLGILFKDKYLLGSITLFFGFLQTILLVYGKWYEEFVGLIETIVSTIICVLGHLYGSVIFSVLIYVPISIFSIINWKKHQQDNIVKLNKMTWIKSIIIIVSIVLSTIILSLLLSLIPKQNFAFLDSLSDILNLAGILLIALRYKEGWILWILCNIVDATVWILMCINQYSDNSIMMIIISVVYFILNIWGFISFIKLRNNQEKLIVSEPLILMDSKENKPVDEIKIKNDKNN